MYRNYIIIRRYGLFVHENSHSYRNIIEFIITNVNIIVNGKCKNRQIKLQAKQERCYDLNKKCGSKATAQILFIIIFKFGNTDLTSVSSM